MCRLGKLTNRATIQSMRERRTFATVLMSGGIDSSACAFLLRDQGFEVEGLFIDYGQAAAGAESRAVTSMADYLCVPLKRLKISGTAPFGCGEIIGRNAFFLFAALLTSDRNSGVIGLGIHAGTHYYDCSAPFVERARGFVEEHTDGRVSVIAPFTTWQKADIYDYFLMSGLPIELTYSCEAGTDPVCGVCASCMDRRALKC